MIAMRLVFLLLLFVALKCEASDLSGSQSTPTVQAFLAWQNAIGLQNIFKLEGEEKLVDTYALTLYAGNLENVIGQKDAETLYSRLFTKLLTFVDTNPEKVELRIEISDGGYCDAAIVRKTVKLNSKGIIIIIDNGTIQDFKEEISCMLDFGAIQRYEESTKKAAMGANRGIPDPASTQRVLGISTNSIQAALTEKYTARDANILVTGKTDNWLSIVVRKLQNEVISDKKYWERLQLFIFLEPQEGATLVRLIVDGKYSAGLAQPDDLGYIDMEPTYTANLSDYGKALVLFVAEVK